mgnify:CR=1 FL=1
MLPAAYKMEPETPRVSGADELDRCIERVAMCDRDAFAVLYRSTSGAVFAYALSVLKNRQDAEDVLHDCYVNIYQTAQAYRSEGKPMAWIMTVTRNLCLHKLRERSRRAERISGFRRVVLSHRGGTVQKNLDLHLPFVRKKLQKVLFEPAVKIPVDTTDIVSQLIFAEIREFNRLSVRIYEVFTAEIPYKIRF